MFLLFLISLSTTFRAVNCYISEGYEQGLRRLNRSFNQKDVASSDSEPQILENSQPLVMHSSNVARALANPVPLNKKKIKNCQSRQILERLDDILEVTEDDKIADQNSPTISLNTASGPRVEPKGIIIIFLLIMMPL